MEIWFVDLNTIFDCSLYKYCKKRFFSSNIFTNLKPFAKVILSPKTNNTRSKLQIVNSFEKQNKAKQITLSQSIVDPKSKIYFYPNEDLQVFNSNNLGNKTG